MKIGFIGCGNMASAMIEGILRKDFVTGRKLLPPTVQRKETEEAKNGWESMSRWITEK